MEEFSIVKVQNTNQQVASGGKDGKDGIGINSISYNTSTGQLILTMTDGSTKGPFYIKGDTGQKGDTGPKGDKGDTGLKGDTGSTGLTGPKGDKGDPGATGTNGATWYNGSTNPTSGTGVVNDYYLNTTSGDVYKKTGTSTWTLQGNIKGPQGDAGSGGSSTGTYELIREITLSATANAIDITNIPTDYKMLKLVGLVYKNNTTSMNINIKINGVITGYSYSHIKGTSTTSTSENKLSQAALSLAFNNFIGILDIDFLTPSYYQYNFGFGFGETSGIRYHGVGSCGNSAAITQITLYLDSTNVFSPSNTYMKLYLLGVK